MKKLLMIPDRRDLRACEELAKKYSLGYEVDDFYLPSVLEHGEEGQSIVEDYKGAWLPDYMTMHGAFYDVIPTSPDEKIREVSRLRIRQSIEYGEKIGVKAMVFHTNYNPFLDSHEFRKNWINENQVFWEGILAEYPKMNIYLENMFDSSPDVLAELSGRLSKYSNYGVCLDYAHALLTKTPPKEWAETLGTYVRHIHLNDHDMRSDLHLGWGDGEIERGTFYELYERYLQKATILIETAEIEAIKRSIQTMQDDGFLNGY